MIYIISLRKIENNFFFFFFDKCISKMVKIEQKLTTKTSLTIKIIVMNGRTSIELIQKKSFR